MFRRLQDFLPKLHQFDLDEIDRCETARFVSWALPAPLAAVVDTRGPATALGLYLECLSGEDWGEMTVDHYLVELAGRVFRSGHVWTSAGHPVRRYPRGYPRPLPPPLPPPADALITTLSFSAAVPGGCATRAKHLAAADPRLVRYEGWILYPDDDGNPRVWAHEWVCTPKGLYIDLECGVRGGCAVAGLPMEPEEAGEQTMNREQRKKAGRVLPVTHKVKLSDTLPGPVCRAPDPAWRPKLKILRATFAEFYPRTIEEWEEGFCRDVFAEREIALWMRMAEKMTRALGRRAFDASERRDIFGMVMHWPDREIPSEILGRVKAIPRAEAEEILRDIGRD